MAPQALHFSTRVTSGVLFIPIITNLCRPFDCKADWLSTGFSCGSAPHIVFVCLSLVVLCGFVPLSIISTCPLALPVCVPLALD